MLILNSGMRLLYLPPYSPDFNPIEEAFSCIKAWIRLHRDEVLIEMDGHHKNSIFTKLKNRSKCESGRKWVENRAEVSCCRKVPQSGQTVKALETGPLRPPPSQNVFLVGPSIGPPKTDRLFTRPLVRSPRPGRTIISPPQVR